MQHFSLKLGVGGGEGEEKKFLTYEAKINHLAKFTSMQLYRRFTQNKFKSCCRLS